MKQRELNCFMTLNTGSHPKTLWLIYQTPFIKSTLVVFPEQSVAFIMLQQYDYLKYAISNIQKICKLINYFLKFDLYYFRRNIQQVLIYKKQVHRINQSQKSSALELFLFLRAFISHCENNCFIVALTGSCTALLSRPHFLLKELFLLVQI